MRDIVCAFVLLAAAGVAAAAPLHDPFLEEFLVGGRAEPTPDALGGAYPADLHAPAVPDSVWLAEAEGVLAVPAAVPEGRLAALLAALPAGAVAAGWVEAAAAALAELAGDGQGALPAPGTPFVGPRLTAAYFTRLAAGDTTGAAVVAARLADPDDAALPAGERIVWHLRGAALTGTIGWPGVEDLLPELGPWDATNAWALAVGLRRAAKLPVVDARAGDDTALQLGRLSRSWLTPADLAAAPFSDDMKAALGGVALARADLADHYARWPEPPGRSALQEWWVRGQRRLHPGEAERYEDLARRSDLAPVWQMDLWRRASERRLLRAAWAEGLTDLERALDLAAQPLVAAGPSRRVREWTEQAFVLALAREHRDAAARVLALAERHAGLVQDERFHASLELMRAWSNGAAGPAEPDDRVDRSRLAVRMGRAPVVGAANGGARMPLPERANKALWDLWRRWGLALSDVEGLAPDRQAAADRYHAALGTATDEQTCLATALARLSGRPGVTEALLAYALDRDVVVVSAGTTPPMLSPIADLARDLRGSQADVHALLGAALALGDMRGSVAAASLLPGSGLTRDEKRRFLYPLPSPGPILAALADAESDPALLLAIARNESLFEPAARSRAGALGWMQIMPFHYPDRGARPGAEHWSVPATAIARGDALVVENSRRYAGDPYRVLAAYNAGPQAVARWDEQLGGPVAGGLFLAWIGYSETRAYVEKVLVDRDVYTWILADSAGN